MIHWIPAERSPLNTVNTCLTVFLSAVLSGLIAGIAVDWLDIFLSEIVLLSYSPTLLHTSALLCWSSLQQTLHSLRVKNTTNIMLHRAGPAQHFQHCWDVSVLCLN